MARWSKTLDEGMAMGRLGALVKFAAVAGPTVWKVVQTFGPTLTRLRRENPEVFGAVEKQVRKLAEARQAGKSPDALRRRISALRDQVAYLRASADDEGERRRAEAWRVQLDKIEASLPLLGAMSTKVAARERAHVDQRIDELSAEILAAFIDEQDEDARQLER
ncbi:hypothetical protein KZX45_16905 [Georgenia sp. EYE_87]|uniref:hypothetical protein n=1 Tax=Georgenia sp. EYE_87 TaxID=2853448 RepID=UPI0020059A3B|nr:hypothetical protein [Georgenia sp. EYE_87]MCK6212223.1 hypothetical protein [Georgenia sp. EYE_87]